MLATQSKRKPKSKQHLQLVKSQQHEVQEEDVDMSLGPFSWSIKLTTTFSEGPPSDWQDSVDADIRAFIIAGKIQPAGANSAKFEPLTNGGFGGTRYFTTRENAEEWAALDRARAVVIPRTIISQVIEDA